MSPWDYLPNSYRPPESGDEYSILWRADLGAGASPGEIGEYLDAFHSAVDIGERWGIVMAEEAGARSLVAELVSAAGDQDSPSLDPIRHQMPWEQEKVLYLAVRAILAHKGEEDAELKVDVPQVLRTIASISVPALLGSTPTTERVTYENPVELIIAGSGFALMGIVQLLRIVRDWKQRRRITKAAADIAEAASREAIARATVMEHLSDEIVAGRLHVPASQLSSLLTREDLSAVAKLAGPEPFLELPERVADFFGDSDDSNRG